MPPYRQLAPLALALLVSFLVHVLGGTLLAAPSAGYRPLVTTVHPSAFVLRDAGRFVAPQAKAQESRVPDRAPQPPVKQAEPPDQSLPAAAVPDPSQTGLNLLPRKEESAYYKASQLSERPMPLDALDIRPPEFDQDTPIIEFSVRVFIDENGQVWNVVPNAEGIPLRYVEPTLEGLKAARFAPGLIDGQAVKSQVVLGFRFSPTRRKPDER